MDEAPDVLPQQVPGSAAAPGDQMETYLVRRHFRMMGGMLVTLGGVAPMVLALVGALSTGYWAWWLSLVVVMVLMTCATAFASLNNEEARRSELEPATWLLLITFGAGAVGVVLGVLAVVALRTWWVVAVPLSAATGGSLVAWLGVTTVRSLSLTPTAGVDLLTRAQKEDVGRLLELADPAWAHRTRLMLLAVAVGWVLPLPGLFVVFPWDLLRAGSVVMLCVVCLCLLGGCSVAVAASRIDPSSAWAIARARILTWSAAGLTLVALVVGGPVAMSLGAQLAASLVISCALLAFVATVSLVGQVRSASRALWRARAGLLGPEVAAWVAEVDDTTTTPVPAVVGAVPSRRVPWREQPRRLGWPPRRKASDAVVGQ